MKVTVSVNLMAGDYRATATKNATVDLPDYIAVELFNKALHNLTSAIAKGGQELLAEYAEEIENGREKEGRAHE